MVYPKIFILDILDIFGYFWIFLDIFGYFWIFFDKLLHLQNDTYYIFVTVM